MENALNLLISASLAKVDHRLPELLFTNTAVVVIVEHPEVQVDIRSEFDNLFFLLKIKRDQLLNILVENI